jgi:arylsulfatase A-like enzyme
MADDLGYGSLGCYGSKEIRTPNIDRLALNGVRLTDFHSNGPMCTPTRAALMTGRYQQRCAWVDDAELSPVFQKQRKENMKQRWAWGIAIDELTIADLLKQAGYRTALFGKWHLGYDFKFHPMNQGFHEFRGYIAGAVDYHTHISISGLKKLDWWKGKRIENEEGYTTDLLTRYAADFIARHKDRPFFLYLAHEAPHTPLQGRDPKQKKSPADTYREMIEVLDESVGEVVEELRRRKLEKNTLLIFCSDNGPQVGYFSAAGPLRGKKGSVYEGGHRVPCIASWPGVIPPGSTSSEEVMTMDFFPTFAKLAGVAPPEALQIDGIDIMPVLKGDTKVHDRALHWLFAGSWAVRRGPWKLIGKGNTARSLVNLAKDIEEKQNHLKDRPERVNELRELHAQWIESVGSR